MDNPTDWNQVAAVPQETAPVYLGELSRELESARTSAIATPLAHFALVHISGVDATDFLQGQFTCDMREVAHDSARFGGYCSPQGRLLASFMVFSLPTGYRILLPAALAEAVSQRLRKFVLRSRVTIALDQEVRAIGIGGPAAPAVVSGCVGPAPEQGLAAVHYPAASLVRLPGQDFLALVPANGLASLWSALASQARPAGAGAWDWLQVQAGIPWITAATQDLFVPQMVGLETLGGVSFEKGCYPGQEIVARTHYLGEVKRRLARFHVDAEAHPGDRLHSVDGQARGVVLNAAPSPAGGYAVLAVVQVAGNDAPLRLGTPAGPEMHPASLSGA